MQSTTHVIDIVCLIENDNRLVFQLTRNLQ
jgi:hypothetical protein